MLDTSLQCVRLNAISSYVQAAVDPSAEQKGAWRPTTISAGYGDTRQILNSRVGLQPTRAAFPIRNSWGLVGPVRIGLAATFAKERIRERLYHRYARSRTSRQGRAEGP